MLIPRSGYASGTARTERDDRYSRLQDSLLTLRLRLFEEYFQRMQTQVSII
jgi:hypothetical protein